MPKKILAIFKAHPRRPQPLPKCVLEIVHTNMSKPCLLAGSFPTGIEHQSHWMVAVREDVGGMQSRPLLDHGRRDRVENDETLLDILHPAARNDEHRGADSKTPMRTAPPTLRISQNAGPVFMPSLPKDRCRERVASGKVSEIAARCDPRKLEVLSRVWRSPPSRSCRERPGTAGIAL